MSKYLESVRQKFTDPGPFHNVSKESLSVGQILAILVPIASMISSVSWAIATYLIVRRSSDTKVELAHLAYESKRYEYLVHEELAHEQQDPAHEQKES